jgi:DNA-binding transcriptional ArsR family regulator
MSSGDGADHRSDDRSDGAAAGLLGLLADERRLKVVAALVLGAETRADVAERVGLPARAVGQALTRLVRGELVEEADGRYRLLTARFEDAARAAATAAAVPDDEFDAPADAAKVLRRFVKDGRLTSIPASHGKRLVVLDWLAQRFEPGEIYPERAVNLVIGKVHGDYATLRRYLVDDSFLERREGFYWRAGGSFDL